MIKAVLKRNNILLSDFAEKLNISRPTLDTYIRNYDSGGKLSNGLFQRIFDFLFSDSQMTPEDFKRRYEYVIENYGSSTDMSTYTKLISGDSNTSGVAQALYDVLDEEALKERFSKDEYTVLAKLISKDSGLLHCIFKYFLLWKGKEKLSDMSDAEKMMSILLYQFDQKAQMNDFSYKESDLKELETAIDKKLNPTKYTSEHHKRKIDEISTSISNLLSQNSGLSIDEIIAQIKKKI